ncbi:kinesin-like protein KIN-14J [Ziziphus jujuba]|uniref:Kinesin-like protein KIN-14J n=1 Tax=Ziziphus jujuba TaxID=326968 RepID=A0ABM4ACG0_ZIZJJ|nr:kinesin-like protein KIN-14J [Ziziphus jujuba]
MNITLESLTDEQWGLESSNGTVNEEAGGEQNYVAMFRGNQKSSLVEWLNCMVPHLRLPLGASVEEMRACLIDGTVLCTVLNQLCPGCIEMESSSDPDFTNVKRFLVAVDELGLPSFELADLQQGSMVPVFHCLSTLKASFDYAAGGENNENHTRKRWDFSETGSLEDIDFSQGDVSTCGQLPGHCPVISEPLSAHEVLQLKQAANLSEDKILELTKSNSFDNASTQSLFLMVYRILDDSIERKNGDVSNRVAYLLRKFMQVFEQRISNQAQNLKNQNNLYRAREEKYQSKIRVLETLAMGTTEENEVVLNQLQRVKIEKFEVEEKKKHEEQDADRIKKEKYFSDMEISTLKQELEMTKSLHENHYLQLEETSKEVKVELEKQLKELQCLLMDSGKKVKELEAFSESESRRWKNKEHIYQSFVNLQFETLKELRASLESIKLEISKSKKSYFEEFNYLGSKLRGLADAAENYHAVLIENRKLYNEVQDLKGNIRVYCRIRPFLPGQSRKQTTIEYIGENGELVIANPSKQGSRRLFKFNKVFSPAATQEEVFLDTQPLIRSVLDGYNVCIFAYGQTGSGKTYTMSGPSLSSTMDWGVNYRALNDLFQISEARRSSISYEVGVQMVEIYNEQVRDLLSSASTQKRLGIWNTAQPNGLAVPDASMHPVKSTSDVLQLMNIGLTNRAVGATALNERSSRSHSVLTVHVRGMDLKTDTVLRGCLHLVDLAGSERVDRSEATGDRLREAQHINKSLSALGDVIFALAQKNAHVPYRNSKLTQVLQSSLGGQAKTLMLVQLNPDVESYGETISTLKFAERVSGVELGAARSNKEGRDVRELMEQVTFLKDTISKKDEEIEQLLKANTNGLRRGMSPLRYGSSSPRKSSLATPKQNHKVSEGKGLRLFDKIASDFDNCSEYSDKHSEAGSQKSMNGFRHQNDIPSQSKPAGDSSKDLTEDFELLGFGDADSEERLSDISDGGLSMGTETEGSISSVVEYTLFPDVAKPVEDTKAGNVEVKNSQANVIETENLHVKKPQAERIQAGNTQAEKTQSEKTEKLETRNSLPSKLPKPTQKLVQTKSSRLSLAKSSSKVLPSPRKAVPSSSSSSPMKNSKRWH